jgi:hypothetical protein
MTGCECPKKYSGTGKPAPLTDGVADCISCVAHGACAKKKALSTFAMDGLDCELKQCLG